MNILAIIPARGGSKGIPKKNIKLLAGKPLITYSIEAAIKSTHINKVIVSTDDKEIAQISQSHDAEIIIRPKELAKDDSPTIDTIFHALELLKDSYSPDILVLLQPTSPLRTSKDIDQAIELFIKNKETSNSLVSICVSDPSPFSSFKIENGFLIPNFDKKYLKMRRQELPKLYSPNGSIYISSIKDIKKFQGFYGDKIIPYEMPKERSIDIDTMMDFKLVELMLGELYETS